MLSYSTIKVHLLGPALYLFRFCIVCTLRTQHNVRMAITFFSPNNIDKKYFHLNWGWGINVKKRDFICIHICPTVSQYVQYAPGEWNFQSCLHNLCPAHQVSQQASCSGNALTKSIVQIKIKALNSQLSLLSKRKGSALPATGQMCVTEPCTLTFLWSLES